MPNFFSKIKKIFLDALFPIKCLNCQKEGSYLCSDCFSLIEMNNKQYCPFCTPAKIVFDSKTCLGCRKKGKKLNGLFFAAPYQNFIIRKIIYQYKYGSFSKSLAKTLSLIIINHFKLIDQKPHFLKDKSNFIFMAVPLSKKKEKWRGFNQAKEIAKELSFYYKIPLIDKVLVKTKDTVSQTELSSKEREENVKNAFRCLNGNTIKDKKIILVDDVFTTGSTMEECAKCLKENGAKEVWGIVVARE